jgi:hypothetical protein
VTFWIAWSIDAIAALILVAFFIIGLADGSVSSFNIGLWLLVLGVAGGVVLGGLALRSSARRALATTLVTIPAVPTALTGLFFLAIVLIPARWN